MKHSGGSHPSDEQLGQRLAQLDQSALLRSRNPGARANAAQAAARHGRALIDLSSNDYLGLAARPLVSAPYASTAAGAGASRLIHGTAREHEALEKALAEWLGTEDALLFSSGYAANVGLVSAIAAAGDVILSDALNHASIIDGARLSRAEVHVLPHRDLPALRAHLDSHAGRTVWYVTEAYFSMDGSSPELPSVVEALKRHGRAHLLLDEAHSLGTIGAEGRGLGHQLDPRPAATVGTFGKAFGLQGAFVAGSKTMCNWLWNRARSFVYSTATSPVLTAALISRLNDVRRAEPERRRLAALSLLFHEALDKHSAGRSIRGSRGPISPYLVGDDRAALELSSTLLEQGILTQAIRPPTVPSGTSRLRMTLHAGLNETDLDTVLSALHAATRR